MRVMVLRAVCRGPRPAPHDGGAPGVAVRDRRGRWSAILSAMSVTEPEAATATGPDGSPPVADRSTRPGFSTPLLLRQALPGALLLGLAVRLVVPIGDPDTFWHLRVGDDLRRTWSFRSPDPWSQFASRPWTLHEWLPELVASLVYQVGGFRPWRCCSLSGQWRRGRSSGGGAGGPPRSSRARCSWRSHWGR